MKRIGIILIVLILSIALVGCAEQETTYTVNKNGIEFRVDSAQKTISEGDNIYHYEFSGDLSSFKVTITYPDGSSYWYNQSGGVGGGGWSDDYDENAYVPGDTLVDVVQAKAPKSVSPGKITGALIFVALGICGIVFPRAAWFLRYGWRYRNVEPSDAALIFARIGGCLVVIFGIVLILN